MPITLPTLLNVLLWLVTGFTSLFTILGFFSRLDWKLELFSHFRIQYALLLGICGFILIVGGNLTGGGISLAFLGINLGLILPIYRHRSWRGSGRQSYRLYFANILGTNNNYQLLLQSILHADADIVLLVEVRPNHLDHLLPHLNNYPHQFTYPDEDNFGLAIFSRLPLAKAESLALDQICTPTLVTRLQLDEIPLTMLTVHPYPPKSQAQATQRNHQLSLTASYVKNQSGELILVGDFNCTSWSHTFNQLMNDSHLLDSRQGIGLQPSWPAGNPLLRVPIDHVLHTPGIIIQARRTGKRTGSDHLPVIVEFSPINGKPG